MRFVVAAVIAALSVGALAGPAETASRRQLYVAPWGNDHWPGTYDRPFRTPDRAEQAAKPNAVVNLRAGTYVLSRPLALDSGVTIQPYGYGTRRQERVTLSGGRSIHGWRPVGSGRWQADVGKLDTRQLFVAGKRVTRANLGHGLPGKVTKTASGFTTTRSGPLTWNRPGDVEFVFTFGASYSEGRCGVASISRAAKGTAITLDQPCFRRSNQIYEKIVDPPGLIDPTNVENSSSFLKPGTWYLDRSRPGHHILTYAGVPIDVVAPVLTTLVHATRSVHDVVLRGLTFAYSTWLGPDRPTGFPHIIGTWYYVGDDPAAEAAVGMPGAVEFQSARNVRVERNHFTHLGAQALEFAAGGSALTVRDNVIDDVSGGGIQLEPADKATVDNNLVHDVGVEYHGSWAILLDQPHDSVIRHNQVNNVPYSGIVFLNSGGDATTAGNTRVLDNLVYHTNNVLIDGGPIYSNGPQGPSLRRGALIAGNVVLDARNPITAGTAYPPYGIYVDDGADYITIRDNVIARNQRPLGGVAPARVRFTGNFWDDTRATWWGPSKQVVISGNTTLPKQAPLVACGASLACRSILATAGRQHALGLRYADRIDLREHSGRP